MRTTLVALFFSLAALSLAASPIVPTPAVRHALDAFDQWDKNHDGTLALAELDHAIAAPATRGEQAAAAVALRRFARSKQHPLTEFTRDSISRLVPALRFDDSRDEDETPELSQDRSRANLDRYYDAALRKITDTPRELFIGAPCLDGFRQGRLGSCFSLAPLSALVHAEPEKIPALFKPAPAGTSVTVTFGLGHAVTVSPLTDGEIALGAVTDGNGLWAATYEKAVGELRRTSKTAAAATPYSIVTRGGSAGTMLSALTGRAIRRFSCKAWLPSAATPAPELTKKLDELRALLRAATEEKRLMTAGTSSRTRKVPSLAHDHAYAVLSYDAVTDLLTVRDPHGQDFTPKGTPGLPNGYLVRRGIFQIPTAEAVQLMAGFAFQLDTPAKVKGYPSSDPAEPATAP